MIDAVVFDFDGLILETEMPVFTGWQEEFLAHGCEPLTYEIWAAEIGTVQGLDVLELMRATATKPIDEDLMHERRRVRIDELVLIEEVRPGVEEWLDAADSIGLKLAVASSSLREWVDGHLVRLGLRDRFEFVACREDGRAAKPAPDIYLAACAALGVQPTRALAVEDSPNGVRAAKAAGMFAVAVPHEITATMDLSEADAQIASLAARPLQAVIAELAI